MKIFIPAGIVRKQDEESETRLLIVEKTVSREEERTNNDKYESKTTIYTLKQS